MNDGMGEIVRLINYLTGRSSGHHTPINPFWFKQNNPYGNIASATIADSIGNTFRSEYIPQQPLTGISRYSLSPIYPWHAIDDRINQSSVTQDKILKIQELKRLINKYP